MNDLAMPTAPIMENFSSVNVDLYNLKKAAMVLRAINHKLRQQILKLIDESGRMTVTEIYVKLRLEQSVASQHLAILRKAGFVKTERECCDFFTFHLSISGNKSEAWLKITGPKRAKDFIRDELEM